MRVLIACEFSGIVRDAFVERGHEAISCDLLPCESTRRANHLQGDVFEYLREMPNYFDLMIAHPPCTHLACSGARWFDKKIADGRQAEAVRFFMNFVDVPIKKIAIENPIGIMSRMWKKPTQIVQPYYFGDEFEKPTCLWLIGLPRLIHIKKSDLLDPSTHCEKGPRHTTRSGRSLPVWYNQPPSPERSKNRSRTFPGLANAMAEQWGRK